MYIVANNANAEWWVPYQYIPYHSVHARLHTRSCLVSTHLVHMVLYYHISWCPVPPGVLYPPCGTLHFIFDGCKVSLVHAFGAFHKHQSLLLRSGDLSFSFSLLMCSSSRWSTMVKLLDSQDLPMEDPVSNMPAVAVVFGLGRALWSVWIRSQGNNERPNQGRASYRLLDDIPSQE